MIHIIDYKMGNARSVQNALERINVSSKIVREPHELKKTNAIILPGVGSFKQAIKNLKYFGLFDEIHFLVIEKKVPYLGICLGMQLIAKDSSENELTKGFGWIESKVRKIEVDNNFSLPHVGWNDINKDSNSILLNRIDDKTNYYFDHSFELLTDSIKTISSFTNYGNKKIISSIEHKNIFGTQFHPEKSQINGLRVLKAFTEYSANREC